MTLLHASVAWSQSVAVEVNQTIGVSTEEIAAVCPRTGADQKLIDSG
jgi:hypothetical protein